MRYAQTLLSKKKTASFFPKGAVAPFLPTRRGVLFFQAISRRPPRCLNELKQQGYNPFEQVFWLPGRSPVRAFPSNSSTVASGRRHRPAFFRTFVAGHSGGGSAPVFHRLPFQSPKRNSKLKSRYLARTDDFVNRKTRTARRVESFQDKDARFYRQPSGSPGRTPTRTRTVSGNEIENPP